MEVTLATGDKLSTRIIELCRDSIDDLKNCYLVSTSWTPASRRRRRPGYLCYLRVHAPDLTTIMPCRPDTSIGKSLLNSKPPAISLSITGVCLSSHCHRCPSTCWNIARSRCEHARCTARTIPRYCSRRRRPYPTSLDTYR